MVKSNLRKGRENWGQKHALKLNFPNVFSQLAFRYLQIDQVWVMLEQKEFQPIIGGERTILHFWVDMPKVSWIKWSVGSNLAKMIQQSHRKTHRKPSDSQTSEFLSKLGFHVLYVQGRLGGTSKFTFNFQFHFWSSEFWRFRLWRSRVLTIYSSLVSPKVRDEPINNPNVGQC